MSGIAAVVLAIVAMSFTQQSSKKNAANFTSYHWFANAGQNDIDLGSITPGSYLGFDTKANMIANVLPECPGENTPPFCATGYNAGQVTLVGSGYEVNFSQENGYEQPAETEETKIRREE